ncbi:MAG TPA: isoprenylcysteine carboxylmethyltransferase family protein [Chthoniobacterales bacterium]|jgi:protein-S-isoprenylcysteine O-methyltransferase Ste14|nr:isoprenylcysteine carboxylmethyltransferase family protein [Chthoniobacterales bacterium]
METPLTGASYRIALVLGIFLMVFPRSPLPLLNLTLWPLTPLILAAGVVLTAAGLAFAIWARVHLGKYWSGRVTLKVDHRVIQTGPYAWVRHPIYSGLILALLGTTITLGTLHACVGFVLIFVSFVRKLQIEENWLRSHFGAEYERYQKRVKALIPHW